MRSIEKVLTLWALGLLPTEAVIKWADAEMRMSSEPSSELMDLSLHGPQRCLKRAESEFPARPIALTYLQEFSVRAVVMAPASDTEVLDFARWMSRHVMGQDLALPEVSFAYQVDHLLDSCEDPRAAIQCVREGLPSLLSRCASMASPFLEQMPRLSMVIGLTSESPEGAHITR